jgi:hemoglobin
MRKLVLAGLVIAAAACGSKSAGGTMGQKPLYDRLGGKGAVTAVVDDFIGNVAGDTLINDLFRNTDMPHFRLMLIDQICEASGGPCKYTGKTMQDVHTNMHITDAQFAALVGDLKRSLDKFKVPAQEQTELVAALGAMKPDIVNR